MADLEPRNRPGPSRRQREQRAYYLVLATGGLAVLAVLCGFVLRRVVAR